MSFCFLKPYKNQKKGTAVVFSVKVAPDGEFLSIPDELGEELPFK